MTAEQINAVENIAAIASQFLTLPEVAFRSRVRKHTVELWVRSGKLRAYHTGDGVPLFLQGDVRRLLETQP